MSINVNGTLYLNQLTDAQVAKVFEFKSAHEGGFTLINTSNQQYGGTQATSALQLGWTSSEGLDLINSLVKELLKTA